MEIHGTEAYLRADLRRILEALLVAQATQRLFGIIHSSDFAIGYSAAISAVAVAVGVKLDDRMLRGEDD